MLQRLDAGGPWPLELVDAVYVFGSFARGALQPNDVDLAVDFSQDERMRQRSLAYLVASGRDPRIDLRQALIGRKRGAQFQFGAPERERLEADGVVMLRLWSRGTPLTEALAVLDGIQEDPDAGRAERDDMAEEFEGLDCYIPRPVRHDLLAWRDGGKITLTRLTLPDTPTALPGPSMTWAIDHRWNRDSPMRRAALSALAHLQHLGADLSDIDLAGRRLPTDTRRAGQLSEPRWWINWKWNHYQSIPHCLAHGTGWLEVLRPTRTATQHALLLTPGPSTPKTPPAETHA
ncbi:nucleotidyltransferase domain-containing protein [Streptomyces melanogenes]|uniref:Nucleotidyltransferase domain-containing protein n=1 Tax=Streptomyces melanogenes TaxID=67326 RepID=A0ABZ1XUX6_9ACTN|nr:nucleotidyltransferase domain-containing protein [Streptomyces melanogenes]